MIKDLLQLVLEGVMIIMYRKKITIIIIKFGVWKKENALKLIK